MAQGNRYIRFTTGYYYYIQVNDLDETYRILRYKNYSDEIQRYSIDHECDTDSYLRGSPGIVLETITVTRYIDLNSTNPQAIASTMNAMYMMVKSVKDDIDLLKRNRDNYD
ncbi:634_t:CDS:1, partial [Acaulospora colombiana]